MKIKVSYRGGNSEQVLLIINSVIDVTIERFIEESPANEGKLSKERQLQLLLLVYQIKLFMLVSLF